MSDNFDVIIIGNGCIGLGLARQLQQEAPGLKVAVVGPADRAGAATMAAGAMLALWAEVEKDHFSDPTLSDRFTLPERGTALWQDYAAGLSEESGIDLPIKWGSYVICNARGSDLDDENFDYMVEQLRLRQQDVEFVSYRELGFLAPANHARPSRVARIPDGHIDARKVVEALETSLGKSADCSLIDARASTLDAGLTNSGKVNGRGKTVTLDNGESLSAPTVVLANGAYAQDLVDQVPPLKESVPRLLFGGGSGVDISFSDWCHRYETLNQDLKTLDHVVRTMDRGGACGVHIVPYGDGRYFLGASSGVWTEPENGARLHGIHALLEAVVDEISETFFYANIALRATGFRPTTMDCFPLLGESDVPGIWFANGMKRDGFTSSPYLVRELAAAMTGGESGLPERFKPSRKLLSYRRRKDAVAGAVTSTLAGEYSHALRLPAYRTKEWTEVHRQKLEGIYEKRSLRDFGIHPELIHLYESDEFFALADHPRELN